jgi:hypothetical protein
MKIKYKIIKLDEVYGQIVVRPEGFDPMCIDLPIDTDGVIPEGEALHAYIDGFLPYYFIERKDKLAAGIKNVDSIKALVEPEESNDLITPENGGVLENKPELSDDEKMAWIIEERNKRLDACDWTQLPDVIALHDEAWLANWRTYRQALRDMPLTIDINNPVYPVPPL